MSAEPPSQWETIVARAQTLHGAPLADPTNFARPALHAAFLAVEHPQTGKRLAWTSPLAADMRRLNEKYRFGVWSFVSSVYGYKDHVEAVRQIVVRELSGYGKLLFFDDRKVDRIQRWLPRLMKLHAGNSGFVDAILRQ